MNRIVSFIAVLAMLISLSACERSEGVKIRTDTKEYITDTLDIKAQVPKFSGIDDRDFEGKLNSEYEKKIDTWIEDFMSDVLEGVKSEFKLEISVKHNSDDFVSMISDIYTYAGGAHGATAWVAENIDVSTGKYIELSELFSQESDYKELLDRIMLEMVEANPDEYGDLWELPVLSQKQEKDFYIEDGKLVIYYHPYELSYYARGFVKFPIELADIQSYMKEEYRRLVE